MINFRSRSIQKRLIAISIACGILMFVIAAASIFLSTYINLQNDELLRVERVFETHVDVRVLPTYDLLKQNNLLATAYIDDFFAAATQVEELQTEYAQANFIKFSDVDELSAAASEQLFTAKSLAVDSRYESPNCFAELSPSIFYCLLFLPEIDLFFTLITTKENLSVRSFQIIFTDLALLMVVFSVVLITQFILLRRNLAAPIEGLVHHIETLPSEVLVHSPKTAPLREIEQIRRAVDDFSQRIRSLGVSIDDLNSEIEARKKAEREKEILIQEVHHRVKNNLQVILSMLSLQKRAAASGHEVLALNESDRRIRVMAKLYEHLYQSDNVSEIDAKSYFSEIIDDAMSSSGAPGTVIAKIHIEKISLPIRLATACAQIISELVSNCIKHAFPKGEGEIKVSLIHKPDSDIHLSISDNGVGLPHGFDETKLRSMGLKLINALVAQIGGRKEVRSERGTVIEIIFPEMT